ncbi:hypothetical protein DID88_000249 [Monilinia fructigena]|uniref:Uncharacterized protein n=1 Tax=Monilinia fructigena TaxID=38457 RepID=A0A395IKV5_9HELO|nr:hypothetical protein DID88_000249 [Monilinia fructigena]
MLSLNTQSIRLAAAGDNGAANAPKADDRERGRVHAGAISPIPLTLPAHQNHTRYSTNSASGQSRWHTGVPSCDNQAGTNRAQGDATTRRTRKLREGCRSLRSQLSGRAKETCTGDAGGHIGLPEPVSSRDRCCKAAAQNLLRGALKTPNTTAVGADPSLRRVALQKRAALPKQGREPEATGTQTVRPSTAGNPTLKSQREKTDLRIYARAEPGTLLVRDQPFLIREAITKAVPQISAKDIPRLWATPTGWAVKPNTKAVYDLILKGSNAALICKATRCTVLERVEKWYTYRLTHTPNVLTGLLDNRLVTADIVSKEAEIQTGVKPVNCHSTGTLGPTSMWYISFKEEVRSFTLFGSSGYSKLSEKKKRIELHNPGCQEYCSPLTCRTASRCNNCGVATQQNTRAQLAPPARPRLDVLAATALFQLDTSTAQLHQKESTGKITRLTASQLGEIR